MLTKITIVKVIINIKVIIRKYCKKSTLLILLCVSLFRCGLESHSKTTFINRTVLSTHLINVNYFYRHRENWNTSKLGAILFKGDKIPDHNINENKSFTILIWRYWDWLQNRHVFNFRLARENINILEDCSVKNCNFTGDDQLIDTVDAVVVHLQKNHIPQVNVRNSKQRWIFLSDESPVNAFYDSKRKKLKLANLNNIFNWSMTFRNDADVPVPYGRTLPLEEPVKLNPTLTDISTLIPHWEQKKRNVLATILLSHCGIKSRDDFLNNLMKYIKVDVYGKCSKVPKLKRRCPGHYRADCKITSNYLFYLALENSHCFQYLSEKVFQHAYAKGAIPIIWGPPFKDLQTLLPPYSFLYADENTDIESLAREIINLNKSDDLLLSMHLWRNHFKVVGEHGYFGTKSYHLCRLCEAMNYNNGQEKILSTNNLEWFLDKSLSCRDTRNAFYGV